MNKPVRSTIVMVLLVFAVIFLGSCRALHFDPEWAATSLFEDKLTFLGDSGFFNLDSSCSFSEEDDIYFVPDRWNLSSGFFVGMRDYGSRIWYIDENGYFSGSIETGSGGSDDKSFNSLMEPVPSPDGGVLLFITFGNDGNAYYNIVESTGGYISLYYSFNLRDRVYDDYYYRFGMYLSDIRIHGVFLDSDSFDGWYTDLYILISATSTAGERSFQSLRYEIDIYGNLTYASEYSVHGDSYVIFPVPTTGHSFMPMIRRT